jgi:hypothetical protein
MTDNNTQHPHSTHPDLRHIRAVAGMSPMGVTLELDGKPWTGLVDFTFRAHSGQLCEVTATFYANVEIEGTVRKVTEMYSNTPKEPTDE